MSLLTDEELMNLLPGAVRLPIGWINTARAIEAAVIKKLSEQSDPVAIVGDVYQLLWFGSGPIAAITSKHGIRVGDKLYPHPAPQSEWQPIETAPKDGTRVLIKGDCLVVAGWQECVPGVMGWAIVNDVWMPADIAKYWMPLPKPPEAK